MCQPCPAGRELGGGGELACIFHSIIVLSRRNSEDPSHSSDRWLAGEMERSREKFC